MIVPNLSPEWHTPHSTLLVVFCNSTLVYFIGNSLSVEVPGSSHKLCGAGLQGSVVVKVIITKFTHNVKESSYPANLSWIFSAPSPTFHIFMAGLLSSDCLIVGIFDRISSLANPSPINPLGGSHCRKCFRDGNSASEFKAE